MKFERAVPSDIDAMERFYGDVNDYLESHINYPSWKKGEYPARETAAEGIRAGNLYVLRDGERIAGSVILERGSKLARMELNWKINPDPMEVLAMFTLAVHPDYLNRSVGSMLMEEILAYGRACGAKAVRLDVCEGNLPAIRLYQKFGFRFIGMADMGLGGFGLDEFALYEKIL